MFEPMIRETDTAPNADGRWVRTDLEGNVFLMSGEKVVDYCTSSVMPPQIKKAIRGWVDRGMTQHETWRRGRGALRGL